ncbi:class I SAM-dependent methyltransferase [Tropicimonas sp. S265A]|uniref:class I SAM-dependent methyltransferase n=1 Tax=Tropicimonas sp. S265A TaxID=3415134 RepID=UPI003C7A18D0
MTASDPNWDAFLEVHKDLPREGPGDAQSVLWALDLAKTPQNARIADLGCGPGADTAVLAQMRPEAQIAGVDMVPQFIEAARRRVPEASFEVGDMSAPEGPLDLIWCAGAIYFLGVKEGLLGWRHALAERGCVAFSEPVLTSGSPSEAVRAFWQDYPQITDVTGVEAQIAEAGYRTLGHKLLIGAPWRAYYEPLQARLDILREGQAWDTVQRAIAEAQREIDLWAAAADDIAYALFVVTPE